ncbi:hypothetical protein BCT61_12610 [Vibrio breoganii]|uniref:hypothetical protein n=1 Tax=Vibrio breoganii TaxID=553239 RepID=UPI000C84E380|nr:hypothetical protein [Vibrio breoganii]PMG05203.1 hypothetical protein BCV00_13560 [Vibrio breoganii]PMG89405.1 hypothetical protein BCU81_08525 [Vibrio breoganii]PMM08374.1 hypothetical protein BCT61_12610 [Vibrio breoganii]
MSFKQTVPVLVAAVLMSAPALSSPLSLDDFLNGSILDHEPSLPTVKMELIKEGVDPMVVEWQQMTMVSTDRFEEASSYITQQSYMDPYDRIALSRHAFMFEYMIQNAHSEQLLLEAVTHVQKTEMCMYFTYNSTTQYAQSRVISMLSGNSQASERMKNAASFVSRQIADSPMSEDEMKYSVVGCSAYLVDLDEFMRF